MTTQNKRLLGIIATVIGLLLIPLIATLTSSQVNWDLGDFLIMGSVLLGIGLTYELIARKSEKVVYRVAFGVGLAGAFLLFWVNGAVGIIGNESQSANMLYLAVFAVGLVGALASRFKASGMAITLFVAAGVQMLVPVLAYFIWPPPDTSWSPSVFGVFLMTAFFAMLFLVSGLLFRKASEE